MVTALNKGREKSVFFNFDIALIKLDIPFAENNVVCPISLMPKILPKMDQDITIVGMGVKNKKGKKPSKLQYANVKRISSQECIKKWYPREQLGNPNSLKNNNYDKKGFCIRGKNKEILCKGDNGSPAIWKTEDGEAFLIGIAALTDSALKIKKEH